MMRGVDEGSIVVIDGVLRQRRGGRPYEVNE